MVLALVLAACGDKAETPKENEKPVVKIGAIFQLTGEAAEANNNILRAFQYSLDNKGDKKLKYELIAEDSTGNPIKGISAAKKLKYVDNVDVLIMTMVNVSKAITKEMSSQNIVSFSIVPDISIANGKNSFTFYPTNDMFVSRAVSELNKGNYKSIAMIVSNYVNAYEYARGIEEKYTLSDITKYLIQDGVRDFRSIIEKVKKQNHDLILMIVRMPESDILMKQFKDADINIPFLGVEYFGFSNHKKLYEGIPYIDSTTGEQAILDDIMQKLNINNEFGLMYGYDLANLIMKVYEELYNKNGAKPTYDEVVDYLNKMKEYVAPMGKYDLNANGNFASRTVIKKIVNGQPVVVEE